MFVNLAREPRFSPLRAETVAWQVSRLRRGSTAAAGRVHAALARHTHATALLMSGVAEHVVSRRLGHLDIQTTQNLYGWVSEDAEQRTVAQWQQLTAGWRTGEPRSLAPAWSRRSTAAASTPRSATWRCGEQVPPELRLTEFSPRTLPDHPAFRWRLGRRPEWRGFDLGSLPAPMQRDFAYCLWRVVDSGLTITAPYGLIVNWFIRLAEDRAWLGGRRCAR